MRYLTFVLLSLLAIISHTLLAHEGHNVSINNESDRSAEFEVEEGLLSRLYEESLEDAGLDEGSLGQSMELGLRFAFVRPSSLSLSNDYFTVPYEKTIESLPMLQLTFDVPVYRQGRFMTYFEGGAGYSYKEDLYAVGSTTGIDRTDLIRLHWIPLAVGVRTEYLPAAVPFLKPRFTAGGGVHWLYQIGNLDGISQGFFVPYYFVNPALVFFPATRGGDWFGGVDLGVRYLGSLNDAKKVEALSIEFGLNVLL